MILAVSSLRITVWVKQDSLLLVRREAFGLAAACKGKLGQLWDPLGSAPPEPKLISRRLYLMLEHAATFWMRVIKILHWYMIFYIEGINSSE